MFDKLIESNSEASEFKPRRKFFMLSSVVVGVLFLTAVVFSLYAQDIDLGTNHFELAELLAPVAPEAPDPEPPREQPQQRQSEQQTSEQTTRQILQERVDQATLVPTEISIKPNKYLSMPDERFILDPNGLDSNKLAAATNSGSAPRGSGSAETVAPSEPAETTPPPAIPPKVETPKRPISLGPVNGIAKSLPKPPYPPHARAVGAAGPVTVQVTIDEDGNVVSANVLSGHVLLRAVSEQAARKAKFTPTLLSKVPVKVTGVITYNFTRP